MTDRHMPESIAGSESEEFDRLSGEAPEVRARLAELRARLFPHREAEKVEEVVLKKQKLMLEGQDGGDRAGRGRPLGRAGMKIAREGIPFISVLPRAQGSRWPLLVGALSGVLVWVTRSGRARSFLGLWAPSVSGSSAIRTV
mgnify:CR=1 FL=1